MKKLMKKSIVLLMALAMLLGLSTGVLANTHTLVADPYSDGLQVVQGAKAEINYTFYTGQYDKYRINLHAENSSGERVSEYNTFDVPNRGFDSEYLSFNFPTYNLSAGTYKVYANMDYYKGGSWYDLSSKSTVFTFKVVKKNSNLNGLAQDTDGNYFYYKNGKVDTSFTGFAGGKNKLIYVVNGAATFDHIGAVYDSADGKWKCVEMGIHLTDASGVVFPAPDGTMYYFNKGNWDRSYNGTAIDREGVVYYVENGIGTLPCSGTGGAHKYKNMFCTGCGKLVFSDVKNSDYFYDPVVWAVNNNITQGTSATTFAPADGCTRAQVVTFLWRAAGCPEPAGTSGSFSDVPANQWYAKAVKWAVENNITQGTGNGKFSPDATCTRAQIVTFLFRAAGSPIIVGDMDKMFNDVSKDQWYANAVYWAVANGITQGTGAGKFSPNDTCTRGQIVTFLYRAEK